MLGVRLHSVNYLLKKIDKKKRRPICGAAVMVAVAGSSKTPRGIPKPYAASRSVTFSSLTISINRSATASRVLTFKWNLSSRL
jgi:hypothetical protein